MAKEVFVSLTVTDPVLIAGIEFARDLYNAGMSETQAAEGKSALTSEEYVTFVGREAVKSYARQKIEYDFSTLGIITKQQRDAAIAALA